jgi:hypothetical protein
MAEKIRASKAHNVGVMVGASRKHNSMHIEQWKCVDVSQRHFNQQYSSVEGFSKG